MAVVLVKPLRNVSGDVGIESIEVVIEYRVKCDDLADGPQVVMGPFPLGRHIDGYIKGGWPTGKNTLTDATQIYRYPYPELKCQSATYWQSEEGIGVKAKAQLFVSNVRIIEREIIDRENGTVNWIVEVTFTRDQNHGPGYSIREIVPYYIYENEPQEYGAFIGLYARAPSTRKPSDGPSQPGQWEKVNDSFINDTVFKGKNTHPDSDEWIPLALSNTIGTPMPTGSLVQRVARPAFRCTWFSYTSLDFADAIGKVNASPYTLVSWDSSWQWPTNSFAGPGADHPAILFYRCFNPRELLVNAVDCELENWSGRRCYRYTVDLIYDRDGHDKYIANVGSEVSGKVNDETPSGGKIESDDFQETMVPSQAAKGPDGLTQSGDIFINYDGTPLLKYDANGEKVSGRSTADALFMKWRIHEEVEFYDPWTIKSGPLKGNYDFQQASYFQTGWANGGELSKCPLFYDGGWRYYSVKDVEELTVPEDSMWPDGKCRPPEPGNEETRYKKKNP